VPVSPSLALQRDFKTADLMVNNDSSVDNVGLRYGFKVSNVGFLLDADTVAEVVPRPSSVRIPRTPLWFSGLTNLRGTLVPIFDLKLLLGLSNDDKVNEKFALIIGRGDEAVGFFVKEYPVGLDDMAAVAEHPPLPKILVPFLGQTYLASDSLYVEFNYPRFFALLSEKMAV